VIGDEPDVKSEEDEELLILLAHTVVNPGTVVVHLLYTPAAGILAYSPHVRSIFIKTRRH
jgi:hypothetical protein